MSADHESPPPTLELVERYVAGELASHEAEQVSVYLGKHPTAAAALDALRQSVEFGGGSGNVDQRWFQLAQRIGVDPAAGMVTPSAPASEIYQERTPRRSGGIERHAGASLWGRITAAGAVVATMIVVYAAVFGGGGREAALQRYATHTGQRMTVRLTDGTSVTLAPQTSLTVARGFGTGHRDVTVDGMAHFDVASATGAPFIVRTGRVTTQVLGTTFSVRHYTDEHDVTVAVASGKVVARSVGSHVLGANMLARFEDSTVLVSSGTDLREYMEWTSGRLVFKEASVEEVMTTLGHWYGLEFRFADSSLAKQHVTGTFRSDARQEVLQTVQLMLGVRMVFDGNVVTLVPGRAITAPASTPVTPEVAPSSHMEVGR